MEIVDVLKNVGDAKSKKAKAKILKENESFALKALLQLHFKKDLKWVIPDGIPKDFEFAKESTENLNSLHSEIKKFHVFVHSNDGLTQTKREKLFFDMLSGLHPDDAQLILDVKDHKLKVAGLNEKLVQEVWDDVIVEKSK